VEKKEETPVQKKKDKGKGIKKTDDIDKEIPMQQVEETMKKPVEIVHVTTPPDSQTFKRLIRQLRDVLSDKLVGADTN
jgi:phosphopantetheine adenylyltransferase